MHLNVWRHHWAVWGRQNIPFGGQKLSYRVETLHTGWRLLALQHIFRFFTFWKFWICDHFSKKRIFWNIWGQKIKILEVRDSHFVDLVFQCIIHFCLHLTQKLYFWWIFKHLTFIGPKSREVTSQNSTYSKKFPADFDFLCTRRRQIDARRGVPSFMSIH